MDVQFTKLIKKYITDSMLPQAITQLISYDEQIINSYQPKDLDEVLMNELLNEYLKKQDSQIQTWVKAEKYLLATTQIDKDLFFERQYLILQKDLDSDLYFSLYEQLFRFRVRMNKLFTIIFQLKSFETFEMLLKQQLQHFSPRMTVSMKKTQQIRKTLFNRPSTFGQMLVNVLKKKETEIEQEQNIEPLFTIQTINGIECLQLDEIMKFTKTEQNLILNVSKDPNKLIDEFQQEWSEEIPLLQQQQQIQHNYATNHKIIERQNFLKYVYGETKKLDSVIMSSLPFNTIQEVEDENLISTTSLQRPLLNSQSAESVLIYGNRLPHKNFYPKGKNLWEITRQYILKNQHLKSMEQTKIKVYQKLQKQKNMNMLFNHNC